MTHLNSLWYVLPLAGWMRRPVIREMRSWSGMTSSTTEPLLVTYPRLGHKLRIASPADKKYRPPKEVWDRVQQLGCDKGIWWGEDPKQAVQGADLVVTDTWSVRSP